MSIVVSKTRLPVTEWQTESGSVVSIANARRRDAKSAIVTLEPIQDLSHGDPSPTNLCPISGHSSVTAVRDGKNLFDSTILGSYGWNRYFKNPLKSAGTITFSCGEILLGNDKKGGALCFADESLQRIGNYIVGYDFGRTVFSVTINATQEQADAPYILFLPNGSGCTQEIIDNAHIQLELGSATAYESYQGISVTLSLGQTVYGGSVDLVSGVGTVDRFCGNVTNVSNKQEDANGYYWYRTLNDFQFPAINGLNAKAISNRLKKTSNVSTSSADGVFTVYANGIVRWKEQGSLTKEQYIEYLSANPLQLCYELSTPITFQLSPNQLEMLERYNTIWADEGEIAVTYARIHS